MGTRARASRYAHCVALRVGPLLSTGPCPALARRPVPSRRARPRGRARRRPTWTGVDAAISCSGCAATGTRTWGVRARAGAIRRRPLRRVPLPRHIPGRRRRRHPGITFGSLGGVCSPHWRATTPLRPRGERRSSRCSRTRHRPFRPCPGRVRCGMGLSSSVGLWRPSPPRPALACCLPQRRWSTGRTRAAGWDGWARCARRWGQWPARVCGLPRRAATAKGRHPVTGAS